MKFVTILQRLHNDTEVVVMTNGSTIDPFPVQTSAKQGCIIVPTLFSIYLTAMLHLTTNKLASGEELTYRTCGKLSNLCRLQAKTKVTPTSVIELQYTDDACICAISEDGLQTIGGTLTEAY
eukprot:g23302.t1